MLLCAGLGYVLAQHGGTTDRTLADPSATLDQADGPAASTQPISARSAHADSSAAARPPVGATGGPRSTGMPAAGTADTLATVVPGLVSPVSPPPSGSRPGSQASNPTPSGPRALHLGDSGADVLTMQKELVTVSCGKVDTSLQTGTFDSKTQSALKDFQRAHKLQNQEDGWYGPATRAVLEPLAQNPDCTSTPSSSPSPSPSHGSPAN